MERTLQQLFQQGNIAIFLNIFFVIDHVFNDIIGDLPEWDEFLTHERRQPFQDALNDLSLIDGDAN